MTASERIRALIKGEGIDRLPIIEWAPWWSLTVENWIKQGLPQNAAKSVYDLQSHFGLDKCIQTYFNVRSAETPNPISHGAGIIKTEEEYEKIKSTMFKIPKLSDEYINWLKKTHNDGDTIHFLLLKVFLDAQRNIWY